MELLIHLAGFVGGWLLVAGPIWQASTELREEAFERDAIERAGAGVAPPKPVSGWWWLLPPVHYLISRRRIDAYQRAVMHVLTPEQRSQIVSFGAKAHGWLFVAGGAFLIATKETWELVELLHWPVAVFWVLIVGMTALAAANTIVRSIRGQEMILGREEYLAKREAQRAGRRGARRRRGGATG